MYTQTVIIFRGTEQKFSSKITQRTVLSFVSALFDPLGIFSSFTTTMQIFFKFIRAAIAQAWDKQLSLEHSKLFSDCSSELREIRTTSINLRYFENGWNNLRLYIFTDASEETMCIVAYLQDKSTLKLTYVIGEGRAVPIRHKDYFELPISHVSTSSCSIRSSPQKADIERTGCQNWQSLSVDRFIDNFTVVTVS